MNLMCNPSRALSTGRGEAGKEPGQRSGMRNPHRLTVTPTLSLLRSSLSRSDSSLSVWKTLTSDADGRGTWGSNATGRFSDARCTS